MVVFIAGGAWIIGYKVAAARLLLACAHSLVHQAWNLFTAPQLNHAGFIVVSPDYRNFPQGHAEDMVQDASAALAWVSSTSRTLILSFTLCIALVVMWRSKDLQVSRFVPLRLIFFLILSLAF